MLLELRLLARVPGRDLRADRSPPQYVEVKMDSDPVMLFAKPERPYHPRKRLEDGAVSRDEIEIGRETLRSLRRIGRRGLGGQVFEYAVQEFGIEDL